MRSEPIDFLQINYSIVSRGADDRVLPIAREKGIAVIANQPFEQGELFMKVRGKALPPWAREFDCDSWAQFFLKFVTSHPAIACARPATRNPANLIGVMGALVGRLPDPPMRERMAAYLLEL